MHPNALLELATELLHQVLRFDAPADGIVSDFFRKHRALGARERHTQAETTYNVLRHRSLYKHLAQTGKGEMERRLALLGWQRNEGFMRRRHRAGPSPARRDSVEPTDIFSETHASRRGDNRACPTAGSDRGSLRSRDLTILVRPHAQPHGSHQ